MEAVQNEVENEEMNDEDLTAIEAKKMWWHAKLECGIIELYTQTACNWYRRLVNSMGQDIKAWTGDEKPEPRTSSRTYPQRNTSTSA